MKYLFIALILFALSPVASAQNAEKPLSSMSYEELLQVDQSSMNKEQKKYYKKTLKTAKKAWQKAEKARKRAEKERERAEKRRLKAEAKRRKAEERARAKYNKPILKQLKAIDRTYKNTTVLRDDFEAFVTVAGEKHRESRSLGDILRLGSKSGPEVSLTSFYHPNENRAVIQLHISDRFTVDGFNKDKLDVLFMKPEVYLERNGHWREYQRASLRGGIQRPIIPIERYMEDCYSTCYFREDIAVELELEDLASSLQSRTPFQVKLSNRRGNSIIAEVPVAYMYGHLLKLSEVDPKLAQIGETAREGRQEIEAQLR